MLILPCDEGSWSRREFKISWKFIQPVDVGVFRLCWTCIEGQ
ncbi:hypothetical protein PA08_1633 [Cutibacterium modestum P08]|nr:hypothetical protein PA08_1633 [Cutibacterium modestum P08]